MDIVDERLKDSGSRRRQTVCSSLEKDIPITLTSAAPSSREDARASTCITLPSHRKCPVAERIHVLQVLLSATMTSQLKALASLSLQDLVAVGFRWVHGSPCVSSCHSFQALDSNFLPPRHAHIKARCTLWAAFSDTVG